MTEIIFRLPSKAVQYGYIEIKATSAELGAELTSDPETLGYLYMNWVLAFKQGEENARRAALPPDPQLAGPVEDLTSKKNLEAVSHEEAQRIISEGLGEAAPWEEEVAQEVKPWEKKKATTPKVVGDLL